MPSSKSLGIKTSIFSENQEFSAKKFCDQYFIGKFNDNEVLENFINSADYFTIETENIPYEILDKIASVKQIFPDPQIVKICQNRLKEKRFLNSLENIKQQIYFEINSFKDLEKKLVSSIITEF